MKRLRTESTLWLAVGLVLVPLGAHAAETVCVEVDTRTWTVEAPAPAPAPAALQAPVDPITGAAFPAPVAVQLPIPVPIAIPVAPPAEPAVDPERYLRRLLEYEVTHHPGFEAASSGGCDHHLTVELYALEMGWTVFGRFSRHSREEKVDHARLDEFAALADRLAGALLADVAIDETLNRENVLRADSEGDLRTVDGQSYLVFGLGTMLRTGVLPTAVSRKAPVEDQRRLLTPPALLLGYRGKYRAWGVGAHARFGFGAGTKALLRNELGGHADLRESLAFGLQFLRYSDPAGVASMYAGMGASFDLLRFEVEDTAITLFPDGRALIEGTEDTGQALALYDRYIGS